MCCTLSARLPKPHHQCGTSLAKVPDRAHHVPSSVHALMAGFPMLAGVPLHSLPELAIALKPAQHRRMLYQHNNCLHCQHLRGSDSYLLHSAWRIALPMTTRAGLRLMQCLLAR